MATCKKKDEKKNAYNTTYGLVLIERIGDDGYVYFDGADHFVRDLCIRHKFERIAALPKVARVEIKEDNVEDEKPKAKRKPRRAKSSDK